MEGARGATGSHRHDLGRAADFDLLDEKGNKVPMNDPRRLAFLEAASRAGAGGAGTGYMSDPLKIHMGITGSAARVGEGLGPYAGSPAERAAINRGIAQSSQFNLAQYKRDQEAQKSRVAVTEQDKAAAYSRFLGKDRADLDKMTAKSTQVNANGQVSVKVANGQGKGQQPSGLFKPTEVTRQTQMPAASTGPKSSGAEGGGAAASYNEE
jgi:hypothetical protein